MMTAENVSADYTQWQQEAFECLIKGDYGRAINLYQQTIAAEPSQKQNYWYLGLTLLLQGQEAEAQTTWMLAMMEGKPEQVEQWTTELIGILQSEAQRQEALADYPMVWTLRQHIREIYPRDINNLLGIVQLSIQLGKFTGEELTGLGIISILQSEQEMEVDHDLLLQVLQAALDYDLLNPSLPQFVEACLPYIHEHQVFIQLLMLAAIKMSYAANQPESAIKFAQLCLQLEPENLQVLSHLATFYQHARQYDESIEIAKLCCSLSRTLPEQIFAHCLLLRGLMSAGGRWQEALSVFEHYESLLLSLIEVPPFRLEVSSISALVNSTFFLPYIRDNAKANRSIQNQVLQLCQVGIQFHGQERVRRYSQHSQRNLSQGKGSRDLKPLKIGYLSHCLKRHSVGWLARWLFEHHNRDQFQVHAYMVGYQSHVNDPQQEWFVEQADQAHKLETDSLKIAEQIYQDDIDILIDLDSLTLDISCEVMALKPAPLQVTRLGWDASGLPGIDYFIADPYVLPESAQDYYSETIWRLPQTYIAVDGFEVGVPTLRRDQLNIPNDAVIYLSAQIGYKRHPDTARLQMQILKQVPNSYFLIKGIANQESVQCFFTQIAEAEGVDCSRLRFLPTVALESTHRANLGIADVVLDTYPYNGATTTLETLWMCIPLVTRVGQQFAARNSYTMMMNAGVTEGITWTDDEYVEWGVRLGKDETLRQTIAWKLRQSRQTAPLWNAKQFTREMEKAYEQMWQRYVETTQ